MPSVSATPDRPVPFGYKTAWLAVRSDSPAEVAAALGLAGIRKANWQSGIAAAYEEDVFVTPPLGGWVLAVGRALWPRTNDAASPARQLVTALSGRFGEAQYFSTYRVPEAHIWARARRGNLIRGYCWVGERGETMWDEGEQTPEECDLGFRFFDERAPEAARDGYWERKDLTFPNEQTVMRLAGRWSLDPTRIDREFSEPGVGLLGEWEPSGSGPVTG